MSVLCLWICQRRLIVWHTASSLPSCMLIQRNDMGSRYCPINSTRVPIHYLCKLCIFRRPTVLEKGKGQHLSPGTSPATQLNVSSWWRLGINFDVIMVPVATRVTNLTNISSLKIAPQPFVYIDLRIPLNHYTFMPDKQFKVESSDLSDKFSYIFNLSIFTLSTIASPFEVLQLCFHKSQ